MMRDSSAWVGFFSLAHIALAGLGVAYMILAPIAEGLGRTRPHFTDLAHLMSRFTLVTYTASIVLAVFMLELFVGLFPLTNSWLFNHFRAPLHLALAVFFVQLLCLYPYYHFWERLREKSVTGHIALGGTAAILILIWAGILDGIGSFMLTPVEGEDGWDRLWNPTWIPLMVHRFFGNLVIAGYVMAAYAGWRFWKLSPRHQDEDYYAMLIKTGMTIGILSLMIQPVAGFFYAYTIQQAHPDIQQALYADRNVILVIWQFSLLALLLLGSHAVFRSLHAERGFSRWGERWYILAILLMVVLAAYPVPRRLITLAVLLQTGWYLAQILPAWKHRAGPLLNTPVIRTTAIILGLASVVLYLTMGTIREVARGPDTINGLIERQTEAEFIREDLP
jgi:hypothetical protein